jgi:kynureninase
MIAFQNTLAFAQQLDQQDILKSFRTKFHFPKREGKELIYFTGNSLGLQPKAVKENVLQALEEWETLAVGGYFGGKHPWMDYHLEVAPALAKLMGAKEQEVVAMNQLTINIHLLLASFYKPTANRYKIICEAKAFPSDQYALETQVQLHGLKPEEVIIEIAPKAGEHIIHTHDIIELIQQHGESVAVVFIGGVNYYTGQFFDLQAITAAAHAVGAYAGYDLAHAAGNVPLQLHDWQVDFAAWCTYKYLNSGPGAIGGVYVHEQFATDPAFPRLAGWWGYDKATRFLMDKGFKAIPTVEGWQMSISPLLSMAVHKAALQVFEEAGIDNLHAKRKQLIAFLDFILADINNSLPEKIIEVITPSEEVARGCQVSIHMLRDGKKVFDALSAANVVVDWREPNVIRLAPVPLYNSFEDIWIFGNTIKQITATLF